jgi:hypothetical protein
VSINNLTSKDFYEVTVQAFTVGLGPQAKRVLQLLAVTPSPPQRVTVVGLTSSSLLVQWNPPSQSSGLLQFYKVYYRLSSSSDEFSISKDIFIDENLFNITGLLPYTSYDIYVTVTNNAETDPESQSSETVQGRTHTAPPIVPTPDNTIGKFTAPHISNSRGPILYVN